MPDPFSIAVGVGGLFFGGGALAYNMIKGGQPIVGGGGSSRSSPTAKASYSGGAFEHENVTRVEYRENSRITGKCKKEIVTESSGGTLRINELKGKASIPVANVDLKAKKSFLGIRKTGSFKIEQDDTKELDKWLSERESRVNSRLKSSKYGDTSVFDDPPPPYSRKGNGKYRP